MIDEERFKKTLLDAMRKENEKPYIERTEYDRGYYNGLGEALQIVCNQIMDEVFEELEAEKKFGPCIESGIPCSHPDCVARAEAG